MRALAHPEECRDTCGSHGQGTRTGRQPIRPRNTTDGERASLEKPRNWRLTTRLLYISGNETSAL